MGCCESTNNSKEKGKNNYNNSSKNKKPKNKDHTHTSSNKKDKIKEEKKYMKTQYDENNEDIENNQKKKKKKDNKSTNSTKEKDSNIFSNLFGSNKDEKNGVDGGTLNNILNFSKKNVGKLKNITKISQYAKQLFG